MSDKLWSKAAGDGGREVRTVKDARRHAMLVVAVLLLACAGAAAALAFSASPAQAFGSWAHDGAASCSSCHVNGTPDSTVCQSCHGGFQKLPSQTCWTCHAPGQDTSSLSSTSAACTQECHLWNEVTKSYDIPFTHGESPHPGASGYGKACLDCHSTSPGIADAGTSPHHSGQVTPPPACQDCHNGTIATAQTSHDGVDCTSCHDGMNIPSTPAVCVRCHAKSTFDGANCLQCHAAKVHNAKPDVGACSSCHSRYRQHAGKVACTRCHTNAAAFHHGTAAMKAKTCRSCHAVKHAGRAVPAKKCASCHKGKTPSSRPAVQHSSRITKKYVCSACHSKPLHAKARGAKLTCRTCHAGKFHRRMPLPANSACLKCHARARSHAVGFSCSLCHRSAIHNRAPRVPMIRIGA